MVKADIIKKITDQTGLNRKVANDAITSIMETMKEALIKKERIELRGFGVFEVKAKKLGVGRNPKTGDSVSIEPGSSIRFKPGKDLRSIS
ncbi:MAG: integration host factor subunit beta [Acidobacteria bacterium]|nr:MAG: integration host factor subunit beta [Acidobacteriota bacterium]